MPDTLAEGFRLLVVTPFMETGGAEKVVFDLAKGFANRGHQIDVASRDGHLVSRLRAQGIGHQAIDGLGAKNPLVMLRNALALRKVISRIAPTVINIHAYSLLPVVRLALLGLRQRPRLVFTLHIPERDSYFPIMARTISLLCDHTISVCAWSRDKLVEEGADGHRISVVYNGVDADYYRADRDPVAQQRKLRIGTVARMVARKGHATLLRSLAVLRESGQDVVESVHHFGDGPERANLEAMTDALGLAAMTTFHGDCADVRDAYKSIDVMILASTSEGLPLTVLEAMSAGVLVSATPVNGVPEVLRDHDTGRIFPVGDDVALAQTIVGLYQDPVSRQKMTQDALRLVRSQFSMASMLDGYAAIFSGDPEAEKANKKQISNAES